MNDEERARIESEACGKIATAPEMHARVTADVSRSVWRLVHECGWSVTRVGRAFGMSRPTVYSHLRWVDALDTTGADHG